ncbi:MAG: DNA-directed RNA polymerase subunit beta' [Ruminococcaceae bacterium]|nr:DNA-directed RNA polymerase subunit beta' [Oscillospiraceae bacterium]
MERNTFDSIKIGLASPEMIRSWSYGEVTKPETINYRSLKAERDGLFCERIFGPTKDWECSCGKYKRIRHKNKVCEKCGVEVTQKKVRRERMGHIELAAPVSHIWYFKAVPSRISTLLDISPKALDGVLYFSSYIVTDPGNTPLIKGQILNDDEYRAYREKFEGDFKAGMGAEAIKSLLKDIKIDELSAELKTELETASGQKKLKLIKRLEVVEAFRKSGNKPEWMILDVIPVIPPEIRPMVQLDGGRFASSDLNDLYRRVINRNNRLKKLIELHAPEIIIRNEKRMLQEAVDALIDNGRHGKSVTGPNNRALKSLSEMLRGKQGRFRQNLLGKRVDYSGRSVIVVGPTLKIYQCGLPKEMALELFKPFVMKRLVETQKAINIKNAKQKVEKVEPEVWDALENVIKEHPVLLNRAPTLHRLSIQAFEPVLVEGRAIKLHPLVCKAFNADFDGDQMPIHVPLSAEAQAEARFLMLSANNLLKPVDGRAIAVPSQDMVLGSFYLTLDRAGEPGEGKVFRDFNEAMMAYENKVIGLHAPIKVKVTKEIDGEVKSKFIDATMGLLIFNRHIPQDLGYVDRTDPDKQFDLEITKVTTAKELGNIIDRCIKKHGFEVTAQMLDEIKSMGYKYSTQAAISISVADMTIPPKKYELVANAEKTVEEITMRYHMGELTEEERYRSVIKNWEDTTNKVVAALQENFNRYNPIKMMSDSGARGNITQMRQLAGMRGLMFAAGGRVMEIPIKSNFREGLNILEYFVAARGARKSLSDTALKTADSGYLTRRLVDVSQEVIIRETDCGSTKGMIVSDIKDGNEVIEPLKDRILGRYVIGDIVHPVTGEVIVEDNHMISEEKAAEIVKAGITEVNIRTVLQCKAPHGVCAHCYGADLAKSAAEVNIGESVGIIAAQSIGEPGTQLTMRTFHTGGVAGADITQGLPRVEELFEARKPKKSAIVAEAPGVISIQDVTKKQRHIMLKTDLGDEIIYQIPYGTRITVDDGQRVAAGDEMTEGYKNPADILRINGIDAVYDYITREVQRVYRSQSININDKHIEVITRQMTRRVKVEDPGDTKLLGGTVVDKTEFNAENAEVESRINAGDRTLRTATCEPVLLGITKAALQTDSFLSAASFQETTKVLTDAAIKGKVDHLLGLKENVIIGKLIPAGTGMDCYRDVEVKKNATEEDDEFAKYMAAMMLAQETKQDEAENAEDAEGAEGVDPYETEGEEIEEEFDGEEYDEEDGENYFSEEEIDEIADIDFSEIEGEE